MIDVTEKQLDFFTVYRFFLKIFLRWDWPPHIKLNPRAIYHLLRIYKPFNPIPLRRHCPVASQSYYYFPTSKYNSIHKAVQEFHTSRAIRLSWRFSLSMDRIGKELLTSTKTTLEGRCHNSVVLLYFKNRWDGTTSAREDLYPRTAVVLFAPYGFGSVKLEEKCTRMIFLRFIKTTQSLYY